jgi:solute:Na+ symporter, SSS family
MSAGVLVLVIIALYVVATVVIGAYSLRFMRRTLEDFHMGSREFGTLVLFSAVFGANISAVAFIGIPADAYRFGWIAGPYFITCQAWLAPLLFYVVGRRAWALGKQHGFMTPAEIVAGRWNSPALAVLIALVLLVYTVPYLMIGLRGAGITLEAVTDGLIPFWAGALIVSLIVLTYVVLGGMRGAAWVNVLQTFIFLLGGLAIFLAVAAVLGGPFEATARVYAEYPELIDRSRMPWQQFFSFGFIVALANPMFPQLFMRLLMGKDPKGLRQIVRIYPLAVFIIVVLMTTLGMWGRPVVPGLEGGAADSILPTLLRDYTSIWLTGVLGAAIFAAMMSTMDSQLLATTTIVMRDFLHRTPLRDASQATLVTASRILIVAITAVSFTLAITSPLGVLRIAEVAFAGFASLTLPALASLYWRRCTAQAAIWSIVAAQIVLIGLWRGFIDPSWTFGFLPGLPALVVGAVVLVVLAYLPSTAAQRNEDYLRQEPLPGAPVAAG